MVSGWSARAAVLVFFLLSGLLITKSIVSNIKHNGYFEPFDYLLNRIARLYPPLIFAIILAGAVVAAVHVFALPGSSGPLGTVRPTGISITPGELIRALLLYDGLAEADGPLWTLYIEVKFYIAAMGIALLVCGRSRSDRIAGAALVVVAVWLGLGLYKFWFFAMIWTLGAAANVTAVKRPAVFLPIALAVTLFGYFYRAPYNDYVDNKTGLAIQAAGCAAVVYALLLTPWLEFHFPNWVRKTGDFSYTLYVAHFPVLALGLSISLWISDASLTLAIVSAMLSAVVAMAVAIIAARKLEDVPKYKQLFRSIFARAKPNAEST